MNDQKIHTYRRENNLTLLELADEMNIHVATLHKIESNVGYRTIRRVLQWCIDHQFDPSDIFPPESSS